MLSLASVPCRLYNLFLIVLSSTSFASLCVGFVYGWWLPAPSVAAVISARRTQETKAATPESFKKPRRQEGLKPLRSAWCFPQVERSGEEPDGPPVRGRSSNESVVSANDPPPQQDLQSLHVAPKTEGSRSCSVTQTGLSILIPARLRGGGSAASLFPCVFLQVGRASGTDATWQRSAVRSLTAS